MHGEELVAPLESLAGEVEKTYGTLGELFKGLFNELEAGLKGSNMMISYFEQEGGEGSEQVRLLERLTEESESVVSTASEYLARMSERDAMLFQSVNESIESLGGLGRLIDRIKEDSIDIELISLNAMTMALKAGNAGKAFSYITDELKKLASRTIEYADGLSDKGEDLSRVFAEFRSNLQDIRRFHADTLAGVKDRLHGEMQSIHGTLARISDRLKSAVVKAREVSSPLFDITDELQTDDIVKQSLHHVIYSMRELDREGKEGDGEQLDRVSAVEILSGLSASLVDDVRGKLEASSRVFEESYETLRATLDEVEQERLSFIKTMTQDGEEGGWLGRFDRSARSIETILRDIESCLSQKKLVADYGGRIAKGLSDIEESFSRFYEIIDRFYSIEVVSRIEVAKQSVLRERGAILTEMSDLTQKIERDVSSAVEEIRTSLDSTRTTLADYTSTVETEDQAVRQLLSTTREKQAELAEAKDRLSQLASGFTLYSRRFVDLLKESERETSRFTDYAATLDRISESLREVGRRAAEQRKDLLAEAGLDKWVLKDNKVESLVEKFTILTHKQVAGSMAGFDVEEGDEAGEMTFF